MNLSAPINICLGITNKCNLSCKHCYVSNTRHNKDLTTEELLNIISQIKELNVFDVDIFGGEPLVRKDFFIILEALAKFKIGICLNTNGILVTKDIARRLSKYYIRLYVVSLDGSSSKIQDPVRGKGSFKKSIEGIRNLVTEKCRVFIATTVTRFNYKDLENVVLLCKKLGVEGILFNKLIYMGKAACEPDLIMSPKERFKLLARVKDLKSRYGRFVGGSILDTCNMMETVTEDSEERFPIKIHTCLAANTKCAIRPDGWVTPCEILWYVKAGDLKRQSLYDIWHNSPVMKEFRRPMYLAENEIPGCKGCKYLNICYRYSRCQPYYYPGRFKHKEFYCWKDDIKAVTAI